MGFMFNGIASADVNVTNLTATALSRLLGSQANNGTTVLGTVPAGKKWRIFGWNHSAASSGSTAGSYSDIQVNVSSISRITQTGANMLGQNDNMNFASNYIEVAAGDTVNLVNSVAGWYSSAVVYYVEVTA